MKCANVITICLLASFQFAAVAAWAQAPHGEMSKLSFLVGEWTGGGWMEYAPGQRQEFRSYERVQSKLQGSILLIEGLHRSELAGESEEVTVHEAMGVISFDRLEGKYRFAGYQADGRAILAEAEVPDERTMVWGFRDPERGARIRFTIRIDEDGHWIETGEASTDGESWWKFLEMTLRPSG